MTLRQTHSLIYLSVALFCGATDRNASDSITTTVGKEWEAGSSLLQFRHYATYGNPAARAYSSPFTITRLTAQGKWAETADTKPVETGSGSLTGSITAESYRHIGKETTVWGHAVFEAGKITDVAWNNSADYDLIGPYVIGDPIGGDLTRRSYDFGGGYAGQRDRWSWGGEASYRASIDYRGRDPRDKIVVSDLHLSAGGSFRPGNSTLAVGVAAKARIYNQTAAIEFYNPINDIPTYAMTGLGSFYPRFSGNSGRNTAYSGAGFSGVLSLCPTSVEHPVKAKVEFGNMRLRQYMRDFNNLELTHTSTLTATAQYGMLFGTVTPQTSGSCYGFNLLGDFRRKRGTENLLGTGTGNSYPKIGERDNFLATTLKVAVSIPVEIRFASGDRLQLTPSCAYASESQELTDPARKASATSLTPAVNIVWGHRFAKGATLTADCDISYKFTTPGDLLLSGLDPDSSIGQAVIRDISVMTSDATAYSLSARVLIPVTGSAALSVKASWQRIYMSRRCGSADYLSLSVGVAL